jgi:elongation factor P hydroxylase
LLPDYGYWYAPDGRSAERQAQFESLEPRPQALEWIFSKACGLPFRPSIDNLDGSPADAAGFARAIQSEVHRRCREGLPERARGFHAALAQRSGLGARLYEADFELDPAWLA